MSYFDVPVFEKKISDQQILVYKVRSNNAFKTEIKRLISQSEECSVLDMECNRGSDSMNLEGENRVKF